MDIASLWWLCVSLEGKGIFKRTASTHAYCASRMNYQTLITSAFESLILAITVALCWRLKIEDFCACATLDYLHSNLP